MIRSVSSSTGASAPTWAAVGNAPIRLVAPPINTMVRARLRLRPIRSPIWPKTNPPTGRITNPTANVANASNVPSVEFCDGKKAWLNTMVAAVAYRKKSYHSMVVPTRLATSTVRRVALSANAIPSTCCSGWDSAGSASTAAPVSLLGGTDVSDARKERITSRPCRPGRPGILTQQTPPGKDRAHPLPEAVRLLEVGVAGQDEVVQAQLRVLGDPVGDLLVRTDQRGPCPAANEADAGPQIGVDLQPSGIDPLAEIIAAAV